MSKKKRKEKRMKKAEAWKGFFFILPSLCGLILFYLLPYLDVIKRSFSRPVTGAFTGLDNYWLVFGNKTFQLAAKNMVHFIITCVPILVISSSWKIFKNFSYLYFCVEGKIFACYDSITTNIKSWVFHWNSRKPT